MTRALVAGLMLSVIVLFIQLTPEAFDVRTWPQWLCVVFWPASFVLLFAVRNDIAVLRAIIPKPTNSIEYPELPKSFQIAVNGVLACVFLGAIIFFYLLFR